MKKKAAAAGGIVVLVITILLALDSFMGWNLYGSVMQALDSEAPVIETGSLPSGYQLDSDIILEVTCEDNVDEVCNVEIIGVFDTSVLGNYSVTLQATDEAGNIASYVYNYEIYEGVNPAVYIPVGYYPDLDGLSGEALKSILHNTIKDHTDYPYTSTTTDVWDILRDADEDPNNPNNIIGFYTGLSIPKDCQDTVNPPAFCEMTVYDDETKLVEWNREHIWSKSRGPFEDESDGPAHTDGHHLVAAERVMNSTKNNRFFEDCHDGDDTNIVDRGYGNYTCNIWEFEPRDEVKGDVARMIFYMAVRYDDEDLDLEVVNDPDEDKSLKLPVYGDIDDLLRWHIQDPVDQKEIDRNIVIYGYQGNRNPFIDMPELVELIWGTSDDYQTLSFDRTYNLPYYLKITTDYNWVILNNVSCLPEERFI